MTKQVSFISTSLPYVNAAPHIGHALEFVQADVLARYRRLRGGDVFFLSGTDDNALKNVQAAEIQKVDPQIWIDKNAAVFQELCKILNISNDDFIRTSKDSRHIDGAKKLWLACKKEDIYKKSYRGLYCVGCEEFKAEGDLANGECPEHPGKKLEVVEEENYFFNLSRYADQLQELIETNRLRIIPESRKNEILAVIKGGLHDFSISRPVARTKAWGVGVPNDDSQTMYVWFDALSNYINGLGYATNDEQFKKYWVEGGDRLHVIGKGITRFHAVYWPAMLLSAGVSLPSTIFVHGYLTIDGQKISKTLGNVIDPLEVAKKYGTDPLRYYLLREFSPTEDGDYSEEKFIGRYNADLANGLGNLVARVSTLAEKHGGLKTAISKDVEDIVAEAISKTREKAYTAMDELRLNDALSGIWELVAFGDRYINDHKPWAEKDNRKTLINGVMIIDNIAALLTPFLPETAKKITSCIAWKSSELLEVKKGENLFPRLINRTK